MGANYFRMGKMDLAEKQWKRARLLAIKHDLLRLKAFANMNLADCYGLNQRFKTAWNHLNEAKKIMESLGDSEGLSGVDFNMALVSIEEGDKKDALYYSTNCLSFPLLYETKRRERLDVLYDRFKKMGWFFPFHI